MQQYEVGKVADDFSSYQKITLPQDETNPESKNTVTWHGPAIKGKIITTGWDPKTMTPPESWDDNADGGKVDGDAAYGVLDGKAAVVEDEL